jgi:hypothetical protein
MASFRPQQQTPYSNSGNEQTVQTGETLGKALQSVGYSIKSKNIKNREFMVSDLSKRSSLFFITINACCLTTSEWYS